MHRAVVLTAGSLSLDTIPPDVMTGISQLVELLAERSAVVLSGAGCSTESGIPANRSPGRPPRTPGQ
jgi:hypothetical protein